MGFRKDAWATIWSVEEDKGNTTPVRLSISKKNPTTEKYETDFSGFCTFIGNAKTKVKNLKPKDRIKLLEVDVTTWYSKEKNTEYVSYKVFDFETANDTKQSTKKASTIEENPTDGDTDEGSLPF